MITLIDEHEHEWVFLESDLSETTMRAFKGIGLVKGELRVWRQHVLSGFLNSPDPSETLRLLIETIEDAIVTGMLVTASSTLLRADARVSHALQSHNTVLWLTERLQRIHEREIITEDTQCMDLDTHLLPENTTTSLSTKSLIEEDV